MIEKTFDATVDNIESVTDFINEQLESFDCPMKIQMKIDVAIDEILSNISFYAYDTGDGKVTVQVEKQDDPKGAVLTFIDHGKAYNPLEKEDPDTTLSVDEKPIGGLGIFMVKKLMDKVCYAYHEGQNILTVVKSFN